MMEATFTWLSIGAAGLAAWLWWRSTRVRYVKKREDIRPEEYHIWLTTEVTDLLEQPFRTSKLQSRVNARAASVTALATLLQAASLIAHRFGW
jgi:hypothetical protein